MNVIKHESTFADLMHIGKAFHESGMFTDVKSAAQAVVKIQAGAEMGIPPFASMSGVHIIQGKPTIGAGLMAARVKGSGKYDYRVTEQTDKVCSIDFYQSGEKIGTSTFTIDDAKKAGTKNLDKFPRNMLFARAMSNGVKWFTPDVFSSPVYVPEEMQDIHVEETTAEIVVDKADRAAAAIIALDALTDLSDLPRWKADFADVVSIPEVKKAAVEKHAAMKEAAK